MNNIGCFPVYIINLSERVDRLAHSQWQFKARTEFSPVFFNACKDKVGAVGLWMSVCNIIKEVYSDESDFVIICEDDHEFTVHYSYEVLNKCINEGRQVGADVLIGGASAVSSLFKVSDRLVWLDGFTGTQFIIVYKSFYTTLLNADFHKIDSLDYKLTELSDRILMIYPFISIQKDFGYSDVTVLNNSLRRVDGLFRDASDTTRYLLDNQKYYSNCPALVLKGDIENISVPVYILNISKNDRHCDHISRQFFGKSEFEVRYLNNGKYDSDNASVLESFRNIFQNGLTDGDDVIVVGRSDLQFTDSYSRDMLFCHIMEAHTQGCDILFGGVSGGFDYALPVSDIRFWINDYRSSSFVVFFRKCFQRILDRDCSWEQSMERFISELSANKMVAFPFLCTQHDFGLCIDEQDQNIYAGLLNSMYLDSHNRLQKIKKAYDKYALMHYAI
ncbi:hypothetical protein [Dyadobacter crusticola]|uniref:hypothetical protein n=1 Tax=Dyadobacter crusticola TaxID=292407 RepID=UPI00068FA542|nr:hypothetical protein [Dyadobacter crusticola]